MGKVSAPEMASILAAKHGISKKEAQDFINAMIAVIKDGVDADRLVKVKGLGTFKVVDVEARQSVSVRSGERLTIEGHSKLTFLPDKDMKEMVNKPFSMFETVTLNDGVDFGEMASPAEEEPITDNEEQEETPEPVDEQEISKPAVSEKIPAPFVKKDMPDKPIPSEEIADQQAPEIIAVEEEKEEGISTAEETENAPLLEIADEPQMETENLSAEPPYSYDDDDNDDDNDDETDSFDDNNTSRRWWIWVLAIALLAAIGVAVWWFVVRKPAVDNAQTKISVQTEASEPAPVTDSIQTAGLPTDSIDNAEQQQPADTTAINPEYYNQMDNRVRQGAYDIVGLDTIIMARRGDTSRRIAHRVFGGEEMSCYIEVFNAIRGDSTLQAGTEIKIPQIERKHRNQH